ncbi:MAG: nucleoside monophosphate kinase [Candidatus Spechtbacterales bacterium]
MNKPICVFVMGRPGAGKDTQAALLSDFFHLENIKTSALLRAKFEGNPTDPLIAKQKEVFDAGELNDPEWVMSVVVERVTQLCENNFDGKQGIIFSGSPRTLYEAERLVPFLVARFGKDCIVGVLVSVSEEEGIERILKRNARPLDRDVEILRTRMQEFNERTEQAIDYLRTRDALISIDGMPTPEVVFEQAKDALIGRFGLS